MPHSNQMDELLQVEKNLRALLLSGQSVESYPVKLVVHLVGPVCPQPIV